MFAPDLIASAATLLTACRAEGLKLVSAESCTGGLIGGMLTEIAGASDIYERGFVTYSNAAKIELLGIPPALLDRHGAVSAAVAVAMADGALKHSLADISVAVTGIAGPGGGTPQKPVGLVYIATQRRNDTANVQRFTFGNLGRADVRLATLRAALAMMTDAVAGTATP